LDIVERLMGAVKDIDATVANEAAAEILLLRHELRQMREDARRYQWLRTQHITIDRGEASWIATGYGLDQTCDQEMKSDR
jgi:hypothetical protein